MTDRPIPITPEDVHWLGEPSQQRKLEQLSRDTRPLHQLLTELRQQMGPDRARLLVEQRALRQRASAKFSAANRMLLTSIGYQQATDEWIAKYKASRFERFGTVADLCCGIGGDTAALAQAAGHVVACDRDPGLLAMAEHNVGVQVPHEVAARVEWHCGDVLQFPLAAVDAWHIDPDRRPAGHRSTRTAAHEPNDEVIDQFLAGHPYGAIKLAPASQPPAHWQAGGELEWISRGGECRQLVVWHGGLTDSPGMRRATILPGADSEPLASVVGQPTTASYDESIEQYCYECDPALLAADLGGLLATELGLWAFAATYGYLTGTDRISHPLLKGYVVEEVLPLQIKRVTAVLREREIGRLTIKHRGVRLDPEALGKRLKPVGGRQGVLIVTRQGERQIALICTRLVEP